MSQIAALPVPFLQLLRNRNYGRTIFAAALAGVMAIPSAAIAQEAATNTSTSMPADTLDQQRLKALPAFIDKMVADQIVNSEVAGAVVTVVYDGKIYYNGGYGFKDIASNVAVDADNTLFRPGSVSKMFTWVALMQQVEAGKVDLDADVNSYIDFEIPRNGFGPIRVRDLLSHSPGMSDVSGFVVAGPEQLVPYDEWIKAKVPRRVWAPGTEVAYSNYAAALAGYIVERVSGQSYAEYVETNIFAPLGMNATTFREPLTGTMAENMATGYKVENGEYIAKPPEYLSSIMPAGSASATGSDMAHFMLAMLDDGVLAGKRILKPESVSLLESNSLANAPHLPGMAHGFLVEREAGPRLVGHAGNTVDFHSDMVIAPDLGFGYFISMTGGAEGSYAARTELSKAITGYMFPQQPAPRWDGPAETAPLGRYRSNRRDYATASNPKYDVIVKQTDGDSLEMRISGKLSTWQRIGPHLYEKTTDVAEGGPYDQAEFFDTPRGARLSFALQPYTTYHLIAED